MPFGGRKIFCLGFNKSGTTSLHRLFEDLGLRALHDDVWPAYSHVEQGRLFFWRHQCFTDGEQSDFARLDRWFPGAVFILNTRAERAWLRSRVKHVHRFGVPEPDRALFGQPRYGRMAREFAFDPEGAVRKWVLERRIYERQVRTYFEGRPGFLEIDVTTTPGWEDRVLAFLRAHGFDGVKRASHGPIHENRREADDVAAQPALRRGWVLVDRVLEELGAAPGPGPLTPSPGPSVRRPPRRARGEPRPQGDE